MSTLKGVAIPFNSPSHDLGGFLEVFAPESVDRTLKENLDVDLYRRICEKTDGRYPPGEIQSGWRGVRTRARREVILCGGAGRLY